MIGYDSGNSSNNDEDEKNLIRQNINQIREKKELVRIENITKKEEKELWNYKFYYYQ